MHITDFKDSADSQLANLETQVVSLENQMINISNAFVKDVDMIGPYLIMILAAFALISCLLPTLLWKIISIVPTCACKLLWCCTCPKKTNKNTKIEDKKDEKEQKLISA